MTKIRRGILITCALCCSGAWYTTALASTQTVFLDALNVSDQVAPPLAAGDVLFVDTTVRGQTGALSQTVTFTVATGVTAVSGLAQWVISTAAGPGPRLVGVNFDLLGPGNVLIVTDAFSSTLGGIAVSTFPGTPLAPGTYTLRATGTGVRESVFDLALEFAGTPPPVPAQETGTLPVQGASTDLSTAFFTTLQDARTILPTLIAGETLLVDTLVTSQTGALAHSVTFTPAPGIDRVVGSATWMISSAVSAAPRLVGLNVDVVDALGAIVVSDAIGGTLSGFAHSTLNGTIGPGAHRIVVTGNGVRDSSLSLSLSLVDEVIFAGGFE